jgi:ATP-binding cassette subfamily F protein 3
VARPLVEAQNVSKSYAGRTLFEGASFQVEPGERVAFVGPNGSGKSTLLAILAGHLASDTGSVDVAPRTPIAFFTQHAELAPDATVRDALAGGSVPPEMADELARLEARMADPALYESEEANEVVARYGELQREVALARAAKAGTPDDNPLFVELGFAPEDLDRRVKDLSGGERTRVLLARVLHEDAPLLVLDEPTNHLDIEGMEWLEERLLARGGTLLFVSHDRAFVDNLATRVLSIERGGVTSYVGNYSEFERRRDEDAARLMAQREREQKELARQKAVIEQFRHQKRFNGQMASRLTSLSKYRSAIEKTPDPLMQRVQMAVGFPESFKSSNEVVRIRGLGKKVGERILFYGLDLDVNKGERIGLVGANGIGKTTLLRILVGKEPKEIGTVEVAPGVKGAYFGQGAEGLEERRSLRDEVVSARPGLSDEDVRAILGRFGFRGVDDPVRKVGTLSGGERVRLTLLKTIVRPSNLLILDEPTNHLDLESRRELARALNAYQGTLLVVSHDRWFLDSVVDKVAVIARRSCRVFVGDLTDARTQQALGAFANEKPTPYLVKKAFKDFDAGVKHTVGTTLELTDADLEAKRVYRTALSLGWLVAAR